ncbi:myosin E, putative [Plasmodium gallinaceum]|uniref:Myosin E, putative n=1 Tax=Plasmodium gallinaceum TaxID=5849 RepID=A0A1J1GR22_PLAGA|nr:myosin E, putative [Plasmodium gallinaceum]CRG93719.1 myosin E, putative [Plasmodium gallinaceum]
MRNSEKVYLEEGDCVWCNKTPSTIEKNNLLYSLCRIIEKKNDKKVLLTECESGDNGCTFLCDLENLYGANRQQLPLEQDDIIELKYINNPTVLHHLHERYKNEIFYTKMGPLLIYINPNKNINGDNEKTIEKYKFNTNVDELNLNIYHIANTALNNLNILKKNQSIIIMGESGSGRREISKKIINFLSYNRNTENFSVNNNQEEQNVSYILKSSLKIIEAFGNAKTEKNNNCSRSIKLHTVFMNDKKVKSFEIKNIWLDKKRLISRGINESSFNIFYYILNGSDDIFKRKYFLKNIEDYKILKNENMREKYEDEHGFSQLLKSLDYIFVKEEIEFIFSVLSALLLLGNMEILENSDNLTLQQNFLRQIEVNYKEELKKLEQNFYEEQSEDNTKIFLIASKLLNIEPEVLLNYFIKDDTFNDVIHSKAYKEIEIRKRIECFIKTCYEELYNWIILKINSKVNQNDINKSDPYINILDIMYFENLKENSLNELLINTTNETIRKIYIDFFFKKISNIYKEEGIESNQLNYMDNENLYKIIVSKEESLFSFLENACIKKTLDKKNLCPLIIKRFKNKEYIKKSSIIKNTSFVIVHSCENITYKTNNFIGENVDILTRNFIEMIKKSENTCMKQLCSSYNYDIRGKIMKENVRHNLYPQYNLLKEEYESKNQMLVTLMRNNLLELTKVIESTFCHFILCLNAHENKNEFDFDRKLVLNQLNKFHILELAQLKEGYFPYIFTFSNFLETFQSLHESDNQINDDNNKKKLVNKERIKNLLNSYYISPKDWRIGKNMIFLNERSIKMLIQNNLSKLKIFESIDKTDKYSYNKLSSNENKTPFELEKITEKVTYINETTKSNIKIQKKEKVMELYSRNLNNEYNDKNEKENELLNIIDLKNTGTFNDDNFSLDEYNKYYTTDYSKNYKSKTKSVGFTSFKEDDDLLQNMESRIIENNGSNNRFHNTYGVMNFINSVTIYSKKLREIHQALKDFDPINDKLKKDSVFNLGMENFYTEKEIFTSCTSENKDENMEKINEDNVNVDIMSYNEIRPNEIDKNQINKDDISENKIIEEDINYNEITKDEINDHNITDDEINSNKITDDEIIENENNSSKLNDSTYEDDNYTFVEKNKSSFDETIDGDNLDENFSLTKTLNANNIKCINYPICCQNNLMCLMNGLINYYNFPNEGNYENDHNEKKLYDVKNDYSINCVSNSKFKDPKEKLHLLNELNDIYIFNSNEKQLVMNIIKQIKNDIEKNYGNKWNIFFCSSDCYFRSFISKEDELVLKKNYSELKNKIMFSKEFHFNKEVNHGVYEYGNTNVVEYLTLPENKKVHEIYISNNVNEKYLKDHYEIICFQSRKVNKFDFLSARSFFKSIDYKILQTKNITHVHIDFSYMNDQMKYNFKQHCINEFISNPNISMEDLSYSLLNLATYFYNERNGTWCVFISTEKTFAGIVNIVKDRYLRMTVQNQNKKYNIILFETPS